MLFEGLYTESKQSNSFYHQILSKANNNQHNVEYAFKDNKHNYSMEEKKQNETDFISLNSNPSVDIRAEMSQTYKQPMFLTNKRIKKKSKKPKSIMPKSTFKCEHCYCSNYFNTLKQKTSHHHKMNYHCISDSIFIMKLIHKTKRILYHTCHYVNKDKSDIGNLFHIKEKYTKTIKDIINRDYFQFIAGREFDDYLTDDDDNDDEEEVEVHNGNAKQYCHHQVDHNTSNVHNENNNNHCNSDNCI